MVSYKHLRHEGRLYATRCHIQEEESGPVAIGFAICSDKDNFSKKIGREISFKRANIALVSKRNTLPIKRNTRNNNALLYYAGFQPKFKSIYWTMENETQTDIKKGCDCTSYTQMSDFKPFNEKHFLHIFDANKKEHIMPIVEEKAPKEKNGKPDWSVFPMTELEEVLKVFEFGAKKYGEPFTYRKGEGVPVTDLYSATFRHLLEIHKKKEIAEDSQCYHWAHVAANALMAITSILKK